MRKLADTKNFLGKLTAARVVNAGKLLTSYHLSRRTRKPQPWGMPMTLTIEPTTACNLRCPECPSGLRQFSRPTGRLKQDFFRRLIDEQARHLIYLIFYFQGEPYLNPDFLNMVSYAHEKGIYTITSTNGHFLSDQVAERTIRSGLDRLIISVDGTTQEVYEQYRREGNLQEVLAGARRLVAWKKKLRSPTPHLIFQFLVVGPNEHQIPDIHRLAKEVGVDEVKLKTAQLYDYAHGNPLLPKDERYARYTKGKDGLYHPRHALVNHCWKMWHAAAITWDGRVVPCCFDKDAQHQLGQLRTHSFRDIWHGSAYRSFRKQLFAGRDKIDICTNCTEGCKVWA